VCFRVFRGSKFNARKARKIIINKKLFVCFRVFRGSKFNARKARKIITNQVDSVRLKKIFSCVFVFFVVQNLKSHSWQANACMSASLYIAAHVYCCAMGRTHSESLPHSSLAAGRSFGGPLRFLRLVASRAVVLLRYLGVPPLF
jgi:hypothetical protein